MTGASTPIAGIEIRVGRGVRARGGGRAARRTERELTAGDGSALERATGAPAACHGARSAIAAPPPPLVAAVAAPVRPGRGGGLVGLRPPRGPRGARTP